MQYNTIEVPLTVSTDAYADNDVFFANTEFGLPARSCKIVGAYLIDKDQQIDGNDNIDFYFFSQNVASLGTVNATADISAANFLSNKLQGILTVEANNAGSELDNLNVHYMMTAFDISPPSNHAVEVCLRSGVKSDNNMFPMYVGGLIRNIAGLDYSNADALTMVLNVEY